VISLLKNISDIAKFAGVSKVQFPAF